MTPDIVAPHWLDLRMECGRLIGKFDPERLLLQVQYRGTVKVFDLAEIISAESAKEKT